MSCGGCGCAVNIIELLSTTTETRLGALGSETDAAGTMYYVVLIWHELRWTAVILIKYEGRLQRNKTG